MSDKKLKECPFCGNKNIGVEQIPPLPDTPIWWRAICLFCSAKSQMAGTHEKAIENWNERHKANTKYSIELLDDGIIIRIKDENQNSKKVSES